MAKDKFILASKSNIKTAELYLAANDPVLKTLIKQHGPCVLEAHDDYYGALVRAMIGQQLSVKAAAAILKRFMGLFDNKLPTPEQILKQSTEVMRAAGLSYSKIKYIVDLAEKLLSGELKLDMIENMSNDEIVEELVKVKGIGIWTSHMFLMFCVGRLDVLPVGDLGIKNGCQKLFKLKSQPSEEQITEIAKKRKWHPYESVASWYIWRSLKNEPA